MPLVSLKLAPAVLLVHFLMMLPWFYAVPLVSRPAPGSRRAIGFCQASYRRAPHFPSPFPSTYDRTPTVITLSLRNRTWPRARSFRSGVALPKLSEGRQIYCRFLFPFAQTVSVLELALNALRFRGQGGGEEIRQ